MSDTLYDVRQEQYANVIREFIRHEDDVTNHRIMWLLVGQGFIANAFVSAKDGARTLTLSLAGLLITFSAFVVLYRSYQARGYLKFLGNQAKDGVLQEEHLPLTGWPRKRLKGWWRDAWICPWIAEVAHVLEPWLFLPCLFTLMWLTALLQQGTRLDPTVTLIVAALLTVMTFSLYCMGVVWLQRKNEVSTEKRAQGSTLEW